MKLENVAVESMDLGYEIPTPGVSICTFEEGISKMTNPASGKTTLRMPLAIAEVVEGNDDNEGRKFSHFLPIQTAYGEKQLQGILSMVGLVDQFVNRFRGDIDPLEDMFIVALQTKLPGKVIKVVHELRKDQKGKDQVNIVRFEACKNNAAGKATVAAGGQKSKPVAKTKAEAATNEEW